MQEAVRVWLEGTSISHFMNWSAWAWPVTESLHFVGLSLLIGTVGVFDLRLLGLIKGVRPADLKRLLRWAIAGFALNLTTGALFFTGIPGMYMPNPAFRTKLVLLVAAGINVLVFYRTVARDVDALGPGEQAPLLARWIGGISLGLWVGVLIAGRMIAFFKP